MTLSRWIRIVVVAILILIALFAVRIHVASGQISTRDEAGDALSGRRLAEAWCTECHSVERGDVRDRNDRAGFDGHRAAAINNRALPEGVWWSAARANADVLYWSGSNLPPGFSAFCKTSKLSWSL